MLTWQIICECTWCSENMAYYLHTSVHSNSAVARLRVHKILWIFVLCNSFPTPCCLLLLNLNLVLQTKIFILDKVMAKEELTVYVRDYTNICNAQLKLSISLFLYKSSWDNIHFKNGYKTVTIYILKNAIFPTSHSLTVLGLKPISCVDIQLDKRTHKHLQTFLKVGGGGGGNFVLNTNNSFTEFHTLVIILPVFLYNFTKVYGLSKNIYNIATNTNINYLFCSIFNTTLIMEDTFLALLEVPICCLVGWLVYRSVCQHFLTVIHLKHMYICGSRSDRRYST